MDDYPRTRPEIPANYLLGFLDWIRESASHRRTFFRTYNEVASRLTHFSGVTQEYQDAHQFLLDHDSNELILHYDVDANPQATERVIRWHLENEIPASVMVFSEKIFDWKLKRSGVLEKDESYILDWRLLRDFHEAGGTVGYHCNAFDRARGDAEKALQLIKADVSFLREHVPVAVLSMHGGLVTPRGESNSTLDLSPTFLSEIGLVWVHNGRSIVCNRTWADGGASNPAYRNECSEAAYYVRASRPGQRTRLLFHPQYYDGKSGQLSFPILAKHREKNRAATFNWNAPESRAEYWRDRDNRETKLLGLATTTIRGAEQKPFLGVRGMSRSGTTLLVTFLGSRQPLGMAIESYQHYLLGTNQKPIPDHQLLWLIDLLRNQPEPDAEALLRERGFLSLAQFLINARWIPLSFQEVGELLLAWLTMGLTLEEPIDRQRFVRACIQKKKGSSPILGSKVSVGSNLLTQLHPDSRVINLLRDPYDVFESQKRHQMVSGALEFAYKWNAYANRVRREHFARPDSELVIAYEDLCLSTEDVSRRIKGFLPNSDVFDWTTVDYRRMNAFLKNPQGQLSASRAGKKIDFSSLGAGRRNLSKADKIALRWGLSKKLLSWAGYS